MLQTEAYREVEPLMQTTYERGKADAYREAEPLMNSTYERGIEEGIERGERRVALRQLEAKFGPLSPELRQQVEALSSEALARLQCDLLEAQSLEELRLDRNGGTPESP